MAIYHFDNKLIDRVEVTEPHPGAVHAKLYAAQGASHEQLTALRGKLSAQSITTLMDSENGSPVLEIRGLKKEKAVLRALEKAELGPVKDKALTEADKGHRDLTLGEKVHDQSLFLSALFYDLGNISYVISGIQRGRHNQGGKFTANDRSEIGIGLAFSMGDVLMTAYGHKKGDQELQAAANSLRSHLNQKGIHIPEGTALNPDSLHNSGAMKEINEWMRRHIIHIKSTTEFAGGLLTVHSGLKPGNRNQGKVVAGILLSSGWLATLLLDKSHKPPMLEKRGSADDTLIDKISDNPRGLVARPLSIMNNISNLIGSAGERKRFKDEAEKAERTYRASPSAHNKSEMERHQLKQHDYMWNVMTAGSFIVAHSLFGMSGTKRPEETRDDKEVMQDLVLVSANMLAGQPERLRNSAIEETAEFIAKQPHVAQSKSEVASAIQYKIETLAKSGWVERTQNKGSGAALSV